MTLNEYQSHARETAQYKGQDGLLGVVYNSLKLTGEAGEIADKVGKKVGKWEMALTDEETTELVKEMGDVLWHVSALASDLQVPLEWVAEMNLQKLKSRQERGVIVGNGDNR